MKHLSKEDYRSIKKLYHIAKNLTNQAIYNIRQHYFAEGKYLNYEKNYALLKSSDNYRTLNLKMVQEDSALLIEGTSIPISRRYYSALKDKINNMIA